MTMDSIWPDLARNIPSAMAVIATIYIMSYFEERREKRREDNAKQMSQENREHEVKIQNMWQSSISLMNAKTDETFRLISEMLDNHESASVERYEKMGVTQDLIKMAKHKEVR
jgi:hypothetical protein